jgi:hypothetical protein
VSREELHDSDDVKRGRTVGTTGPRGRSRLKSSSPLMRSPLGIAPVVLASSSIRGLPNRLTPLSLIFHSLHFPSFSHLLATLDTFHVHSTY